jgi:hypothetical protein
MWKYKRKYERGSHGMGLTKILKGFQVLMLGKFNN